jgi:hypothetical protein
LSVEAFQAIPIDVCAVELTCNPCGTDGRCVSGGLLHGEVAAEIVVREERFPDASYASTATAYVVPHDNPEKA